MAFDRRELVAAFAAVARAEAEASRIRLVVSLACLSLVLLLSLWLSRGVLQSLSKLATGFDRFGRGDFSEPIPVERRDEIGALAERANQMAHSLQRLNDERDRSDWLKAGHAGLVDELRGELETHTVAERSVRMLARYLSAPAAALYYLASDGALHWLAGYASAAPASHDNPTQSFTLGDGLVGEAALQQELVVLTQLPPGYMRIRSGLGESQPSTLALVPLVHLGRVMGVLELAFFEPWSDRFAELLLSVRQTLTIAIEVARARASLRELLAETQRQAQRLGAQEDELRANNEELQLQHEELRLTNTTLTQQTEELERQQVVLERKNAELDSARQKLEQKAVELSTVSAYKTQFLANMSHELRTPLNSMLLLSNLLADNEAGNLSDKQVEFCKTIHGAGRELLGLINQVLDLAKIESGKQTVTVDTFALAELAAYVRHVFEPPARHKGLDFSVVIDAAVPETLSSDLQRLQQILNNLLGNAIKFTERGRVALHIGPAAASTRLERTDLHPEQLLAFSVSDTGIGIAPEHRQRIFVPFEQGEAGQQRRFGGTGLGLSIARELATLLGGELQLTSMVDRGSTFVLYLPLQRASQVASEHAAPSAAVRSAQPPSTQPNAAFDVEDRPHLLVVEDDAVFGEVLTDIIQSQGLKHLLARDGQTALRLAKQCRPTGIILDVKLADIDGWQVMEALRADPVTANIPVHFVSALEAAERGLAMGAVGYLTKPATREDLLRVIESLVPTRSDHQGRILIVEDDVVVADSLSALLESHDIDVHRAVSAQQALEKLALERFSCMVLDLGLPDMDGLSLLELLKERLGADAPPAVVYTGRALSKPEAQRLEAYTEAIVLKEGPGAERLLDEIRIFTQRLKEGLRPKRKRQSVSPAAPVRLEGSKILVADDDMRTVYALSALLRAKGAEVLVADTGKAALGVLDQHPDVHAVLMDIMMPEMDGYEALRHIRNDQRFSALPVIVLTAKAMKNDRHTCLQAGANDYLAKPVDADRLIEMLRAQLEKSRNALSRGN
jgi:CheY-like chemotaxis protein/signal transduction histidine kinase/HAMP domain-containing protein